MKKDFNRIGATLCSSMRPRSSTTSWLNKFKLLAFAFMALLSVTQVWGASKTITLDFDAQNPALTVNSSGEPNQENVTVDGENVHFAYTNGSNGTTQFYVTTDRSKNPYNEIRTYAGTNHGTVTITSTSFTAFTSITVYATSKNATTAGTGTIKAGSTLKYTHSLTTATSTSSGAIDLGANCTSILIECTVGQYRIQKLVITGTVESSVTYTNYLTDCATTWDVTIAKNEETWGAVDQASVTGVADQTVVSASSNVLTIGITEITATPTSQDDQYTYAFDKWTNIPVSGKITEDVTITANFTRTARTYNVTYNDQGGADYSGNNAGSLVANYTYGTGATLVAGTKYGFNFEGWYDNQGCTGSPVTTISNSVTGNKTFYAKWSEDLSCSWNLQGTFTASQWQLISMSKETGHSAENVAYVTQHINAGNYWFKFYNSNGDYDIGAKIGIHDTNENFTMCSSEETSADLEARVSGDYRFKLDWSTDFNCPTISVYYPAYVTVTFNMNGHGDAIADKYCVPGGIISAPVDPTAANFIFGGWYENASCTGDAFNFSTTLNANKTLYAKWTFEAPTYYYRGDDNSWGATEMTPSADHLYSYIQSSNSTNQFKISKTSSSFDYNYSYVSKNFNGTNVSNIGDYSSDNCYCWQSGTYYIIVYYPNTAINTSSSPKICASTSLPGNFYVDGGAKLYFDNTLGNWAEGKQHLRIGRSDHSTAVQMTKVTGTANLYQCTVPAYNNYFAFTVANSAGWTDGHSIYQPSDVTPTGEYAITEELVYQNYLLDVDYTLLPTSKGSTDKGCTYINTNHEPGMKMQNVSITEYSHGTVNVAYTDIDGSASNFTTGNRNVAHTCILTITATPETGARLVSLKVNGNNFTSGQTFVADATTEITAVFSNEWTLTWDYADGTVVSAGTAAGSVAYGTSLTAPALEKTGYDFNGWNPTVPATMPAANSTYTAQWTLAQYTINPLNLTGCSVTGTAWPTGTKAYGSTFSTTISANDGYDLPATITVSGATHNWNPATGLLEITSVTGDVTVSIVAVEKTYVNYRTSCTTVTTVTLNKGDHGQANGSATIKLGTSEWKTFTAVAPMDHFDLDGYYYGDTKVIDANGTLFSNVSGWTTSDGKWDKDATTATLTAKFTQRTYTVTLNDNGVIIESPKVNEGESYTLPALSCESEDFEKVGWTKTAPTDNRWASKPTLAGATVSEGGTYYAVYGEGGGEAPTNDYKLITGSEFESGANYVIAAIVDATHIYAMSANNYSSSNHNFERVKVSPDVNNVIKDVDAKLVWKLTNNSIYSAQENKYVGADYVNYDEVATFTSSKFTGFSFDFTNPTSNNVEIGCYDSYQYYFGLYDDRFEMLYSEAETTALYKQQMGAGLDYISNPVCCVDKVAAPMVNDATKTHNSITLSWSNVTGATGYKVTINGDTHDVTTSSCSHTESGLTHNTAYSWTVVATWDPEGAYCGAIPANGSTTTNPLYTLTITDTEGVYNIKANGSTKKTQSFAAGTEITLSETTRNGYIFGEWVVMQGETPITVIDNKFTMPAAEVTVTATFTTKKDYYVDDMNDNEQIVMEGQYTVPGLPDVVTPSSNSCEQTHLYFVGWIEGEIGSGQEEEPTGLIRAGAAGTAKEKTYHAVWAEDANSNQ